MLILGPCLYSSKDEESEIIKTAEELADFADYFRCKIFGGGTTLSKYNYGVGLDGLSLLNKINGSIMPTGTEVHTPEQLQSISTWVSFTWIGARNCQNYSIIESIKDIDKDILFKRGPGMTIDETANLYDIYKSFAKKNVYVIERGVNTLDRQSDSRWSPDLKGVIRIKLERPDIFDRLIIDCSHSVGKKEFIADTYRAFHAIGCRNFMFECTYSGKSKTDQGHMLSVDELKDIINSCVPVKVRR